MSEWMPMERWPDCQAMERPGIVFQLRNREGLTLLSRCETAAPAGPFDWVSSPIEFRAVPESAPVRSAPMPKPVGPG